MDGETKLDASESPREPFTTGPREAAVKKRRWKALYEPDAEPKTTWGLALSGGGIRSATFCLGVLQALAKAKFSHSNAKAKDTKTTLLARFDFLSTVSGGGYVGSFFSALFRPRSRVIDPKTGIPEIISPELAAKDAYRALQNDPPGRMAGAVAADSADPPLRWLRENGRYLAPNGPGDLLYDVTIAVRNLISVHYVAGITLLTLFLLAFSFRFLSVGLTGEYLLPIEMAMQPDDATMHGAIWWSPWFLAAAGWILLLVLPIGAAYWYRLDTPVVSWNWVRNLATSVPALVAMMMAGVGSFVFITATSKTVVPVFAPPTGDGEMLALLLFNIMLCMSVVIYFWLARHDQMPSREFRSNATRTLSWHIGGVLLVLAFAAIETGGQTLYLWMRTAETSVPTVASIAAGMTAMIALIRTFSPALAQPGKGGLLTRIPLDMILGIVGIVLLTMILITWHALASYFFLGDFTLPAATGRPLILLAFCEPSWGSIATPTQFLLLIGKLPWQFTSVCIVATFSAGVFLGFVNLSSLQTMYSARLSRAYLGASNRSRFASGNDTLKNVTEPDADDDFTHAAYFDDQNLGPAHIINVTINATTGSGDALTQRDRQGLPMAITPDGILVEGVPWLKNDMALLKIGQWIGISGAAFSTGIGRGTSLGKALVLGLTNVRLGWWWQAGQNDRKAIFPLWRNQAYLLRELRASFMGKDGAHWYLSDGGHFENTAVFELLRRRLDVVVCCDCGADPDYEFEDLANLMRLARIDFAADFTPVSPAQTPLLSARAADIAPYFAMNAADLAASAGNDNKCALLYRVTYKNSAQETLLIVLKPRLIKDAPLDIVQYHSGHPDFPQQSTIDQFFDEAQWESYRKLGALIGAKIFPH